MENISIRSAEIRDAETLVILEAYCWEKHLRASKEIITDRILRFAEVSIV